MFDTRKMPFINPVPLAVLSRPGFRNRIRWFCLSGSGSQISMEPDPVLKVLRIRFQPPDPGAKKKSAERAPQVIYSKT